VAGFIILVLLNPSFLSFIMIAKNKGISQPLERVKSYIKITKAELKLFSKELQAQKSNKMPTWLGTKVRAQKV
jgi:hypothetical protein